MADPMKIEKLYILPSKDGFTVSFSLSSYKFIEFPVDASNMSEKEREEFYDLFRKAGYILNESSQRARMAADALKLEEEGFIKPLS